VGRPLLATLLALCAALAGAEPSSAPLAPVSDAVLVRALKAGGLVIYMRHASTDFSQNDTKMKSYEDCATQRNLNEAGRAEAQRIGEAIRKLGVPLREVLASPFCRTMETAMLAFGKVEKSNDVRGGPVKSEDPKRYAGLLRLMSGPQAPGANLAISSHGNPFFAVAGPPYLQEAEIAVIRPKGTTGFEVIARIRAGDWARLAP
jgi:phosphohistidine phosphatase SixA